MEDEDSPHFFFFEVLQHSWIARERRWRVEAKGAAWIHLRVPCFHRASLGTVQRPVLEDVALRQGMQPLEHETRIGQHPLHARERATRAAQLEAQDVAERSTRPRADRSQLLFTKSFLHVFEVARRGPLEACTQRGLAFHEAELHHLLPCSVEKLHAIELARSIQQRHQGHAIQQVLEEERIAFVGHGAR